MALNGSISVTGLMNQINNKAALRERFYKASQQPPLMMLYPPVSTGEPYDRGPDAFALWNGVTGKGTLYIHIPFCPRRCAFCPFHAAVGKPGDYDEYLKNLLTEAAMYSEAVRDLEFNSVYFGGGTPSVLAPARLSDFLGKLAGLFRIADADISLEAHPGTLDAGKLDALCAAGISRLSLGIQSFNGQVLQASGRGATTDKVRPVLEAALATPFREVNIDLMYGLPDQDLESWRTDLKTATKLEVPGVTLYSTVYLADFTAYCKKHKATIPGTEHRFAMYDLAYDYLNAGGYPQPHFGAGAFLRGDLNPHRQNVALGLPTLGLGTWSYSSTGQFSYHNLFPRAKWALALEQGKLPIRQLVRIPGPERARKYVIEAMLLAYLDLDHFQELFGADLTSTFPDELDVLQDLELVDVENGKLRLTRKGGRHLREVRYLFASNAVVTSLESGAAGL